MPRIIDLNANENAWWAETWRNGADAEDALDAGIQWSNGQLQVNDMDELGMYMEDVVRSNMGARGGTNTIPPRFRDKSSCNDEPTK